MTALFGAAFHHLAQESDDFGCIFETFVVHTFLRVVNIGNCLFGEFAAGIGVVETVIYVCGVFELYG